MRIGVARLLVVAGIAALAFSTSYSQTGTGPTGVTANADNATPMPGAGHDYIHLLGETVSPANGSVNIKINFGAPPSRGITLPGDSVYDSGSVLNLTQDVISHEIEFEIPYVVGQGDLFPVATWTESSYQPPPIIPGTGLSPIIQPVCNLATGFTFRGPDGVRHNVPLAAETTATQVSGGPTGNGNCGGSPGITVGGSGSVVSVSATDGVVTGAFTSTAATLAAVGAWQINLSDPNPAILGNVGAFTITDAAGNTYFFDGGSEAFSYEGYQEYAYQVEDRNGNIIPWCGLTYCDTAGRPMDASTSSGFTVGGVNYTNSNGTAGYAKISYTVPETQVLPLPKNNPEDIGCNGEPLDWNVPPAHSSMGTPEVPREQDIGIPGANGIELYYHLYFGDYNPNDSTVENPYGLINEIIYPDGGWVKYTWNLAAAPNYTQAANFAGTYLAPSLLVGQPAPNGCVYEYATPAVAERQVSYDGTTVAQTQKFSYSTVWNTGDNAGTWAQKTTTVNTTDNITGKTMQTIYTYMPGSLASLSGFWGSEASEFPVEQTVARYDWGNTTTPLDTEIKAWYNSAQVSQLACDFHISNDGKSTGHFYQYQYAQISDDKEYDYGQIPNPATYCTNAGNNNSPTPPTNTIPIRETVKNFQTFVNPQGVAFAKPSSFIVYSNGSPIAETDYSYDQFSLGSPVKATNHDETNYSPSLKANRGNATTITHLCAGCTNATTTYTYDETGQLSSMTDPCGNAGCTDISGSNHTTTYSFTDSPTNANAAGNSNAYVTQVTMPNTGVAHTESYQYNYVSGQLTQATDENGNSTTYAYNDPLLRITGTTYPDGGSTAISYVDSAPSPSVTTTTAIRANTTLRKKTIIDGMGHVVQTQLLSDPSGQVNVDTVYNGVGGVYSVSNPYGPSGTSVLATNVYDGLGRKVTQKQTDGSSLQWCYNGVPSNGQTNCLANASSKKSNVWIDFSDENGNHWQRSYDGLGRLGSVMEPNSSQVPSIETDYSYNGLDDLVGATQNGVSGETPRTRSFTYNSLGQLTSASNPEAGTICYGIWSGSKCLGNGYDANGNVAVKSDARNVVTSYKYDVLNRVSSKTYSNDPSSSPYSCYQYDSSAVPNAVGRLTAEWTQSASAGACSTSASSIWTKRLITKYDTMGRVQNEQQFTPATLASGTPYSPAYLYDLAGNLISSTDGVTPSHTTSGVALTFSNCFDGASRLQTVSSNWIDTTHPQSLFSAQGANSVPCPSTSSPTVSGTTYAPFGGLMNAILGNRLSVNRNYDIRLRLTGETDTGTGAAAATLGTTAVTVMGSEQVK